MIIIIRLRIILNDCGTGSISDACKLYYFIEVLRATFSKLRSHVRNITCNCCQRRYCVVLATSRRYFTCDQVATEFRRQLYGGTVPASLGEQFLTEVDRRTSRLRHELHQVNVFGTDHSLLTSQHTRPQR